MLTIASTLMPYNVVPFVFAKASPRAPVMPVLSMLLISSNDLRFLKAIKTLDNSKNAKVDLFSYLGVVLCHQRRWSTGNGSVKL